MPTLVSARNDTTAFQIILQSNYQYSVSTRPVEYFSRKSGVRGPHERIRVAVNAPFDIELDHEGLITDHDDIKKADILLKQDVLECPANLPTGVFAKIKIQKRTAGVVFYKKTTFNQKKKTEGKSVILDL